MDGIRLGTMSPRTIELIRKPENIDDHNAILVRLSLVISTPRGKLLRIRDIGYIGREYAEKLAPLMDGGVRIEAEFTGTENHDRDPLLRLSVKG